MYHRSAVSELAFEKMAIFERMVGYGCIVVVNLNVSDGSIVQLGSPWL